MKKPIWQISGAPEADDAIMAFLAGDDVVHDRVLFPYDVRATGAHVRGLCRIGVLTEKECERLCELLDRLEAEFLSGKFLLDERFEDGHSAIEHYLTTEADEVGEKVHTGRSRNDQVLVASRLYLKDALDNLIGLEREIAIACLERAEADAETPMPGYTHLQRAIPSSIGMWLGGFAEAFADTIDFTGGVAGVIDCNPLGTAAGYGVNLALDREGVTTDLGFGRMQINPVAAQMSRGKFEIMALQAASHALHDVSRLAWDLSLFSTAEFGFVQIPDRYTTGSSIMPNKRNPDVVELLRARPAVVDAAIHEIGAVVSLPSGYHRDLQFTKPPMIRGLTAALQALAVVPGLVRALKFDSDRLRAAISREMFATDAAVELAAKGMPFRTAYRKLKQEPDRAMGRNPEDSLRQRVSPGAAGDLRLEALRRRLADR